MDKLEDGLKDTDWFTGANFGIADAAIFPYVLRWEQLTLSDYCNENSHPKLNDWFNKVKNSITVKFTYLYIYLKRINFIIIKITSIKYFLRCFYLRYCFEL